jgi:hypothetical protein
VTGVRRVVSWVIAALLLCLVSGTSIASGLLPAPTTQAIRYQNSQDWFWCADQAMGLLVPSAVLLSGLASRLADRCRRLSGGRWFLTIVLFALAYATIDFLMNLHWRFGRDTRTNIILGLVLGQ